MKRSAPMKRTGFQCKAGSPFNSLANAKTAMRRTEMRRRVKKPTVEEGSKYLAACKGEPCYLRVFGVCVGMASVVPCHSNQSRHGKGAGLKAKHEFTVPGCQACHAWVDQGPAPREVKFRQWDVAYARWAPVRARKMGLKEEGNAVLDSHTDGYALANAACSEQPDVCHGAVSTDGDTRNDRQPACLAEGAEQGASVRLGGCLDSGGSAQGDTDHG